MTTPPKYEKCPVRNLKKNSPIIPLSQREIEEIQREYEAGHYNISEEDLKDAELVAEFGAKTSYLTFDKGLLTSVNGANVKKEAVGLIKYEDLNENNEAIGVKIVIEEIGNEIPYLDKFFDSLPYGIINKSRTGVGATSLEIKAERNSIIVMPTKILAFSKVLGMSKTKSDKFLCNYVGSKMEEVKYNMPSISEYLQDDEIKYKKFIVVADSLYKVIESIGASVYNNYFLMLDEIDSYQSDSTFRKSMANTLDYYFEFDEKRRCVVTATMQEFSNPQFEDDPVIEIEYPPIERRKVNLIHTNNPNAIAKEKIEELYNKNAQSKILIAYNKVQYIMEIIENLDEKYRSDCAVLCSEMSYPYVIRKETNFFNRLNGNKLPKRINFITCTYFAGIDIEEPFHLISVANVEFQFVLLSPDRLTQIAGRGREGLHSEYIIYNTKPYNGKGKWKGISNSCRLLQSNSSKRIMVWKTSRSCVMNKQVNVSLPMVLKQALVQRRLIQDSLQIQ